MSASNEHVVEFALSSDMFLDWGPNHDSAWVQHIPFMGWLVGQLRPRTFVELGSHWGVSYFSALQASAAVDLDMTSWAVDTWQGDPHAGFYGEQIYEYVLDRNKEFEPRSQLIRSTFDAAVNSFDDGTIDLLHIDGMHTYDAVKHDFESWLPKISARGVVIFHDTAETRDDFGVHVLWSELTKRYPSFSFEHGHGLGVLAVGADVTDSISRLVGVNEDEGNLLRSLFSGLGYAQDFGPEKMAAIGSHAAQLDTHIETLQRVNTELQEELNATRGSFSWRVTGPLRRVRASMRRTR